jgi:glycosyltransferase involved in cell wall biosynthesis
MGHSVSVTLPEEGPLTEMLVELGAQLSIEPLSVLRRVSGAAGLRMPLRLPAASQNADVIVLWTVALAGYLPTLRARRRRVICSVHEILLGAVGRLLAAGTSVLSHSLMVNSEATRRWITGDVPLRKAHLAYPVAPPYEPIPRPATDTDALQILLMGRVNGHKGHLDAVLATQGARDLGVEAEIALVGGSFPGQEHHLADLLALIEDRPWARYGGEVADTRGFLERCDVVLVPTNRPEPFGVVALEAWAAGRRVVASNLGGLVEATTMVEGITVPANDVPALSQALVRVARDPTLRLAPRAEAPVSTRCTSAARELAWRAALSEACV